MLYPAYAIVYAVIKLVIPCNPSCLVPNILIIILIKIFDFIIKTQKARAILIPPKGTGEVN